MHSKFNYLLFFFFFSKGSSTTTKTSKSKESGKKKINLHSTTCTYIKEITSVHVTDVDSSRRYTWCKEAQKTFPLSMIFQNHQILKTNAIDCIHRNYWKIHIYAIKQISDRRKIVFWTFYFHFTWPYTHSHLHSNCNHCLCQRLITLLTLLKRNFSERKNKITHLERSGYLTNLSLNYFITHHF